MRSTLLAILYVVLAAGLASAAVVNDSRSRHEFAQPPQRVVALSWSLAEQLLELGVTPVGVADVEGYGKWVVRPALPEDVASVGLRKEPNLERIAELAPDVILASDDQLAFVPNLEKIAPVLHFDTFSADHDNHQVARETFIALGRLFDREAAARTKLADLDARLAALRAQVAAHFGGAPPEVTVVRPIDDARVAIHGENAMPVFALRALGLDSGFPLPATQWGITLKKWEEIGRIRSGIVLYIEPFEQADEVFSKTLWQAMPVVREGRVHPIPATWTYGGATSVGYLAEVIARKLLELPGR